MAEAAQGTSTSAQESQKAANELAEMAARLRQLVEQFKISEATNDDIILESRKPLRARAAALGR